MHIQPCSLRERFLLLIQLKGGKKTLETGDTEEETLLFKTAAESVFSDHCSCCSLLHREVVHTSPNMLSATLTVARRVPKEGATSESKAGVVKLKTKSTLYSARSRDCGETASGVSDPWGHEHTYYCHSLRNTSSLDHVFAWRTSSTEIIPQSSSTPMEQQRAV